MSEFINLLERICKINIKTWFEQQLFECQASTWAALTEYCIFRDFQLQTCLSWFQCLKVQDQDVFCFGFRMSYFLFADGCILLMWDEYKKPSFCVLYENSTYTDIQILGTLNSWSLYGFPNTATPENWESPFQCGSLWGSGNLLIHNREAPLGNLSLF